MAKPNKEKIAADAAKKVAEKAINGSIEAISVEEISNSDLSAPAIVVDETESSVAENPTAEVSDVAESLTDAQQQDSEQSNANSLESSEATENTETTVDPDPTEDSAFVDTSNSTMLSDSSDSVQVEDELTGDLEDQIQTLIDNSDAIATDPIVNQIAEAISIAELAGAPDTPVTADDKIKGGEKVKTANPNVGASVGGGPRGKEVWLILNEIPDRPPFLGPMNLTKAYETALEIVNDLKSKNFPMRRDGERGLDRFWHNGKSRIFYSEANPNGNEIKAPAPIRPLETVAPPKKDKSAKNAAATPAETKSAKEILAEQKKAREAGTLPVATPAPKENPEEALAAVLAGVQSELTEQPSETPAEEVTEAAPTDSSGLPWN